MLVLVSLTAALSLIAVVLGVVTLLRRQESTVDISPLTSLLEQGLKNAKQEIADSREESRKVFRELREELTANFDRAISTLDGKFITLVEQVQRNNSASLEQVGAIKDAVNNQLISLRDSHAANAQSLRDDNAKSMKSFGEAVNEKVDKLTTESSSRLGAVEKGVTDQLTALRNESALHAKSLREESGNAIKLFNESINKQVIDLTDRTLGKVEQLREQIDARLSQIREDNDKKLEEMRRTVDEKLHDTLDKRLGESFKQVSERLERVHAGLGEMQQLATGVGDLKRVLTNVKARGTWGEVILGNLLEEILTPDQFERNVCTKETREAVEFAVRIPSKGDGDDCVLLPIDSKFPREIYERLLDAQETGDLVKVDSLGREFEACIRDYAKKISEKYLNPPKTTDFAVLFLPTEGLFAEAIRRTDLVSRMQQDYRISIVGPTYLAAFLNCLQMGFRTLAIEKRSSEVWELLAAVKTEWSNYGLALGEVQKKLHQASEKLERVHVRNRAVERKLRHVQQLPADEAQTLLRLEGPIESLIEEASAEA